MANTLNSRLQLRNDTAANWTTNNPIMLKGEAGIEIDSSPVKLKIGDGVKTWTELSYFNMSTADFVTIASLATTLADYAKTTDLNAAIAALGTLFKIKGSKPTVGELPTEGNANGDVYLVGEAEYVWVNDISWELLGTTATVDLTNYYNKTESDNRYYQKTDTTVITTADTLILNCGNA